VDYLGDEYKSELLTLLKLFVKDRIVGLSYEEKDGKWGLFIHLSGGVINIVGDKEHKIESAVYVSPIIENIPWDREQNTC